MKSYKKIKQKALKDVEIRKEYEKLVPHFEVVKAIVKKRVEVGMSQRELASRIGTKQSAVSRLESGTYNPTLSFLDKVARALDTNIKITVK